MIKRIAQNRLVGLLEQFPAVGIIGPRQVGKTTLSKLLQSEQTIYLDLESDIDLIKLTDPGIFLRSNKHRTIIIDEVQTMPELFPLLRSIIDEDRRPGRFVLLGSAAPSLLRDTSESLAGRIAYMELTPFLLGEVNDMKPLWTKGGFPNAYLEDTASRSMEWRDQFISSYIQRDLPLLGLEAGPRLLGNFLRMLANSNGSLWNASLFAKSLGLSSPTVKRYLEFLEGAFLIDILEPFYTNAKKRITKSPKTYFKDTGLLHSLLRISSLDDLYGHPAIGGSWENFVIQQVKGRLGDRYEYFFYRTQDGTEMDLVLARAGKPLITAEIKYTLSPKLSKGTILAVEDLKAAENYIITAGKERFPVHEKIEVTGLEEFLRIAHNR